MKQMALSEFGRLKNLMALTGSNHDGEALSAIRAANRLLSRNKLSWADVFERTITVDAAVPAPQNDKDAERAATNKAVQNALDELRGSYKGGSFFDSIDEIWTRDKYLTPNRRAVLFNMLREHREKRRRDD